MMNLPSLSYAMTVIWCRSPEAYLPETHLDLIMIGFSLMLLYRSLMPATSLHLISVESAEEMNTILMAINLFWRMHLCLAEGFWTT